MKKTYILIVLVVLSTIILFHSCKKDDKNENNNKTATCVDGIQNQGETGIDCGGPCSACPISNTVTDIDGNVYNIIKIGNQTWMLENLKVVHYRNGDPIPNITDNTQWNNLTTGAYCDYNNDVNNVSTYGRLYNWHTISDSRNIAPLGWHVPTDAEWTTLSTYLGGENVAGGKLKEAGLTHWGSPNTADNSSGFTALPGGYRQNTGVFNSINYYGHWWSSTQASSTNAWDRYLEYKTIILSPYSAIKTDGFSIRCVKD